MYMPIKGDFDEINRLICEGRGLVAWSYARQSLLTPLEPYMCCYGNIYTCIYMCLVVIIPICYVDHKRYTCLRKQHSYKIIQVHYYEFLNNYNVSVHVVEHSV